MVSAYTLPLHGKHFQISMEDFQNACDPIEGLRALEKSPEHIANLCLAMIVKERPEIEHAQAWQFEADMQLRQIDILVLHPSLPRLASAGGFEKERFRFSQHAAV